MTYPTITFENEETEKRFHSCEDLAKTDPKLQSSWDRCWESLKGLGGTVSLYVDFAPHSFLWRAGGFLGGLIFHGVHDGFGSGGPPTYSTTLGRTTGWALHT